MIIKSIKSVYTFDTSKIYLRVLLEMEIVWKLKCFTNLLKDI